jgi:hypothetical protein
MPNVVGTNREVKANKRSPWLIAVAPPHQALSCDSSGTPIQKNITSIVARPAARFMSAQVVEA